MQIEKNVSLGAHTTLQVGGVADYFIVVRSEEELREALAFVQAEGLPHVVFGEGTNLLVGDAGYRGAVIRNQIVGLEYAEAGNVVQMTCGAGLILDEVIADAVSCGYWGLENLSAIPGTVGATPIQNVGAYGVEVSQLITHVTAIHAQTLEKKVFDNTACGFAYRDSFFKTTAGKEWIVIDVSFALSSVPCPQLGYGSLQALQTMEDISPLTIRAAVTDIRLTKFPDWRKVGTAGSFFKNPIITSEHYQTLHAQYPDLPGYPAAAGQTKVSLGWILEHICQLKGFCKDGVCLYEHQALVLINKNAQHATAIEDFAHLVAQTVFEKTKIKIEWEVRKI